jgi:SAM-dependent methyltransferase
MEIQRCRVCGHGEAKSLGQIPDSGEFAGQLVSPPIKGGELWKCKDCCSMFRHPTLSSSDYISLYEKAPSTVWVEGEIVRNDFEAIYSYFEDHIGGSILDVGCYSGNFLTGLPAKFKKYGIEPSDSASRFAASNGIEVLGKTLTNLDTDMVFDVVVSIDVIEHVLDVEKFLKQALAHVKESGWLVVSTGNPSCFAWRKVFKSKYWYSLYPEHVTFPSYKYFKEFSKQNGLPPPEQICFRYMKMKPLVRFSKLLRYAPFFFFPAIYQGLRKIRRFTRGNTTAVSTAAPVSLVGVFADHHVIVFRKKDCDSVKRCG